MELLEAFDLTRSYRAAAQLCGVDHHTVKRAMAARAAGYPPDEVVRTRVTRPFIDKIEELVERSSGKIRADVVHERLVAMGYTGSERTTRRVVATVKEERRHQTHRVYRPWIPEPGLWLQYDFGTGPEIDGLKTWSAPASTESKYWIWHRCPDRRTVCQGGGTQPSSDAAPSIFWPRGARSSTSPGISGSAARRSTTGGARNASTGERKRGLTTGERAELIAARNRIRALETELAVHRRSAEILKEKNDPKSRYVAIQVMAAEGLPVELSCRVLGVSVSGYFGWRSRPPSQRGIRHAWLTDVIAAVHASSRETYGARRVHAELTMGRGIAVGHSAVELLMRRAGIQGLSGRPKFRRVPHVATATDLVNRQFTRSDPDRLWVNDITEDPTREWKLYCCVVLDVFSRRVVGWSIDSHQETALVTNAWAWRSRTGHRVKAPWSTATRERNSPLGPSIIG